MAMPPHAASNNGQRSLHNRRRSAIDVQSDESILFNESDASPRGAINTERNRGFHQRSPTNQDIRELDDLKIRDLSTFSRVSAQAPRVNHIFPRLEDEADDVSPPRQRTVSEPALASEGSANDQDD